MNAREFWKNGVLDGDEPSEKQIKEALEQPGSFALWPDHPHYEEMYETWSLGPVVEHRDSGILDQANTKALLKLLESDKTLAGEFMITECGHWAVGWVKHISFRALDEEGKPTRVFRVLTRFWSELEAYPVADENLYSDMEYEATIKNIESAASDKVREGAPKSWPYDVAHWIGENYPDALQSTDDQGGWPDDEILDEALEALQLQA